MKKIQLAFAVSAIMLASVGVFANKLFSESSRAYFQKGPSDSDCTVPLTLDRPCEGESQILCTFTSGGVTYQVQYIDDANPTECENDTREESW